MAKSIIEPWGRQPTESSQAFEAFVTYRDMGTSRSLRTMAEQHSLCERQLFEWSRKLDWQKRISAWEEFLDRQARNAQAADVMREIVAMTWLLDADCICVPVNELNALSECPTAKSGSLEAYKACSASQRSLSLRYDINQDAERMVSVKPLFSVRALFNFRLDFCFNNIKRFNTMAILS